MAYNKARAEKEWLEWKKWFASPVFDKYKDPFQLKIHDNVSQNDELPENVPAHE